MIFLLCNNKMGLFNQSMEYAVASWQSSVLMLFMCISNIVVPIIRSELLIRIPHGDAELVKRFLMLEFVDFAMNTYIIQPLVISVAYTAEIAYNKSATDKYATMTFDAKNTRPSPKFIRLRDKAGFSVFNMFEWGIPNITNMIGVVIGAIWIFYRKQIILIAAAFVVIGCTLYIFCIRPMQNRFTKSQKDTRASNELLREHTTLNAIPFQYKERSAAFMSDKHCQIITNDRNLHVKWNTIMNSTKLGAQILNVAMCYLVMSDAASFMMIFVTMSKVTNTVNSMSRFGNQYNRLTNDFDAMVKFWPKNSNDYINEPTKMYPDMSLMIDNINIIRGKCRVRLNTDLQRIPFYKGIKILIRGKSGGGKSTLLDGILGKIGGVCLNVGSPSNYYHTVADMFQAIGKKIPTSKVTIRDYFKDEPSNAVIEGYMRESFPGKEYDDWIGMLGATNRAGDDIRININAHPFDIHFDERISGGQHMRLILATRSYEVDTTGKQIIVLDEPEQGSDPDTIVHVMNRFLTKHVDKTIIMISHMCKCQMSQLQIKWDLKLHVNGGVVNIV